MPRALTMNFATPKLEPFTPPTPKALQETLSLMGGGHSTVPLRGFNRSDENEVATWRTQIAKNDAPTQVNYRLLRALIQRLPSETDPLLRNATVEAALNSPRVGWRHLWLLWEQSRTHHDHIIPILVHRLDSALNRRPHLSKSLPPWLGRKPTRMASALAAPAHYIIGWILKANTPIESLVEHLGCSPTSPIGEEILLTLAKRSPATWWANIPPKQRRNWASRWGMSLIQAVAERELIGLGARAGGARRVHLVRGALSLKEWIDEELGSPTLHPGLWKPLPKRAHELYQWLCVAFPDSKTVGE